MHAFPHYYQVSAYTKQDGDVVLSGSGLSDIASQPPAEFDGPGDRWSPESLLTAAVADCFALSFRAIAAASKVSFSELAVEVQGALDMVERKMKFTAMKIQAKLTISEAVDPQKAERLLHMAENSCLVTNSLDVKVELQTEVAVG